MNFTGRNARRSFSRWRASLQRFHKPVTFLHQRLFYSTIIIAYSNRFCKFFALPPMVDLSICRFIIEESVDGLFIGTAINVLQSIRPEQQIQVIGACSHVLLCIAEFDYGNSFASNNNALYFYQKFSTVCAFFGEFAAELAKANLLTFHTKTVPEMRHVDREPTCL